MSRTIRKTGYLLTLILAVAATPGQSQEDAPQSNVDPEAVAALDRMGAALRRLTNVSLRADVTTEEVLTTGQKLQYGGAVDIMAQRPNRLRMNLISDRKAREFYYDGETATLFSPRIGYFATFDAPPTIRELLEATAARYDLELPLVALLDWGTTPERTARLTSAFQVGTETIGGATCDHYAMREEGQDWQVWIAQGDNALPCKLVITTTDDPSMPQYVAAFTWKPAESFPADTFAFTPPENSRRIAIGIVDSGAGGSR